MKKHLLVVILLCCSALAAAQEIVVAAASDLSSVFPGVAARFEQETGRKVTLNFGSSGQFLLQIENGAPIDIFFSADLQYPQRLESEGLTQPGSFYKYAVGKLVLYVPNGSAVDPSQGLRALLSPQVRKIAIANPQHAPYGRAAEAALRSMGLYESVEKKLVLGENISQTLQFIQSGAADTGIVALSLAVAPNVRGQGRYWEVPRESYPKMEQGGVILKDSPAAREFRDWLLAPAGRGLLKQYGFFLPGD